MQLKAAAGSVDLRNAARLKIFNAMGRLTDAGFPPASIAFFMYTLSEAAQTVCEEVLKACDVSADVMEMVNTPLGISATVWPTCCPHQGICPARKRYATATT